MPGGALPGMLPSTAAQGIVPALGRLCLVQHYQACSPARQQSRPLLPPLPQLRERGEEG